MIGKATYEPSSSYFVRTPHESKKEKWLIALTSFGFGVAAGYFNARGIRVNGAVYKSLIYGPTIFQSGLGAILGGTSGAIGGKQIFKEKYASLKGLERMIVETKEVIFGAIAEGSAKSVLGMISGGAETLVGYLIGNLAGRFY